MAVSKSLRFQVLRRDNHTCRYCGRSAPEVRITVDHVVPAALGGGDTADNLVAACHDCNSGKAATPPDAQQVAQVQDDALRWAAAMQQAATTMIADAQARRQALSVFTAKWEEWKTGSGATVALPPAWEASVERFLAAGLPMPVLLECVEIAMGNTKLRLENIWRYMCGVAWSRVTELQEAAKALVRGDAAEAGAPAQDWADAARGLGWCFHVGDGQSCPEIAKHNVYLAKCAKCGAAACRGHEGLCDDHLREAVSRGLRAPDGSLIGIVTRHQEIVDCVQVDA